jgi:hypothetical protein
VQIVQDPHQEFQDVQEQLILVVVVDLVVVVKVHLQELVVMVDQV